MDGRTFWVRPVGAWVLQSGNVVAAGLAASLDKPLEAIDFLLAVGTMLSVVDVILGIFGATGRVKPGNRLKLGILNDISCLPRI